MASQLIKNPQSGAILVVPAGGQIEAEFDFLNDSPDVAVFRLEADGLPDLRWLYGLGEASGTMAAASGGGSVRLTICPSIDAVPGDYPCRIAVMCGDSQIGQRTSLTIRVGEPIRAPAPPPSPAPPPAAPVPPVVEPPAPPVPSPAPPVAATPAATAPEPSVPVTAPPALEPPAVKKPVERKPKAVAPTEVTAPPQEPAAAPPVAAPPVAAAPESEPAPITPPIAAVLVAAAPPEAPAPAEAAYIPPSPEPEPPVYIPPPAPEPPPATAYIPPPAPAPEPEPEPEPEQPAYIPPAPRPAPVPPARMPEPEADLPIVDLAPQAEPEPPHDEPQVLGAPTEPSLLNPHTGDVLSVRPAESLLVRFSFVNTQAQARTYVLDEDRSLERGWLTLVQDQVNITRNGEAEVSFRLTPPADADAGEYPFTVTVGPQGGALTQYGLILSIPVVPAVHIVAKATQVTSGPFSRSGEFGLVVDGAGNSDTAFRIGVVAPESKPGDRPVTETPDWCYFFDKELETLESPGANRPRPPVPVRLRITRRGPWWLGWRESHTVQVAAVPVTEPLNGGKEGNRTTLTFVRWRLLPFPALFLIPIIAGLMLLVSGGAKTLQVSNAFLDSQGRYWAVQPPGGQKTVALSWTADKVSWLRLTSRSGDMAGVNKVFMGSGTFKDTVNVTSENRKADYTYQISRLAGGGDQDVTVSYIFTRGDTPLAVTDLDAKKKLLGGEVTVAVPATGYAKFDLTNASAQFNRVDWWMAETLDQSSPYQFLYVKNSGSIEPGDSEHFVISRNPGVAAQDEEIVFITTDATRPTLTVHLVSK